MGPRTCPFCKQLIVPNEALLTLLVLEVDGRINNQLCHHACFADDLASRVADKVTAELGTENELIASIAAKVARSL